MAHQWFGNIVTPLWWSHLWLSEGFSSFFEIYIFNEVGKNIDIIASFVYMWVSIQKNISIKFKCNIIQMNHS